MLHGTYAGLICLSISRAYAMKMQTRRTKEMTQDNAGASIIACATILVSTFDQSSYSVNIGIRHRGRLQGVYKRQYRASARCRK